MSKRRQATPQLTWFRSHSRTVGALTLVPFLSCTLSPAMAWAQAQGERTQIADSFVEALDSSSVEAVRTQASVPESGPGLGSFSVGEVVQPTFESRDAVGLDRAVPDRVSSDEPTAEVASQAQSLPTGGAPIAAQAISLPSGAATVGGMGESFTAQLTTGIATLNLPFAFPSARGLAQTNLSLVYASSGGFGDAGVGWSLAGQVFVTRQTDRGAPSYDDRDDWHPNQDRFIFGGSELVPICLVTGGACAGALEGEVMPPWADGWQYFRSRVEGMFLRFFWSPDHRTWRIQSKDGVSFELGLPLDGSGYEGGLEANPTSPAEIYRWHLVRQYDAHGQPNALPQPLPANPIVYRYLSDGSIKYLSDIYLTSPATSPRDPDLSRWAHHLAIDWELRPDQVTSYRAGFAQVQRLRLARVDVTSKPFTGPITQPRELVRRYHASYDPTRHASLLASVQLEGRCDVPIAEDANGDLAPTDCARLPAVRFGYQEVPNATGAPLLDSQGLFFSPFNETIRRIEKSPPHSIDESLTALMDIDSDSLPDLLVTAPGLFSGKHGVFFNGKGGEIGFGSAVGMGVTGVSNVDAGVLSFSNSNVSPLDIDGDATVDLLHMPLVKTYSVFTPEQSGTDWNWVGRSIASASAQDPKIDFTQHAKRIVRADVNADGLLDFVFSSSTELQTFFSLGRLPGGDTQFGRGGWKGPDAATISNDPMTACLPWSASPIRFDDPEVRLGDINGDGLPDIVRLRSGQILYWPGRGNGFWGTGERDDCAAGTFGQDRHIVMSNAPFFGAANTVHLGDVNGDGLSDLVEFRFNAVDVYLNDNGSGWTERRVLSNVPIKPNGSNYVQITDVDGSGTPDLLWGRGHEYRYIDLTGGIRPMTLTRIENGLGKVTELEYSTSARLMLDAKAAGHPWSSVMPLSTPVVVRSIVRDRLEKVGRPAGAYVTEYSYRDPVFDGRQREFRGFRSAESRVLGDANSPTATTRSTFLLGECEPAKNGFDVCKPGDRWRDNWREPLKGLTAVVETFDDEGTYLSTAHTQYELRQLYTGRDGRRVSVAYPVGQESFGYDTADFVGSPSTVLMNELTVNLDGISQSEQRAVPRRASAGTVRLRSSQTFDNFGNPVLGVAEGCVEGCETTDEVITSHSETLRPTGDLSGWLLRPTRSYVTGSVHTAPRHESRHEYDAAGDLDRSFVTLSGTLPLDRFHSGGGAVAPAPLNASAGVTTPVEIQTVDYTRDAFGTVTAEQAPLGRCRSIAFDPQYADLPIGETVYGGPLAATGCGERAFSTTATYDRGQALLLTSTSITGQPSRFDYDEFGRLVASTFADPENPGFLADYATATYEYLVTEDPATVPFSILISRVQDGEDPNDPSYHEAYSYADGMGRTLLGLSEADPLAGDGGSYIIAGVRHYDAKGAILRAYQPFFWSGDPLAFPVGLVPATSFSSAQQDAFGRTLVTFGLDGLPKSFAQYHALSQDLWDAEDIKPGPHYGSYGTAIADGHGRSIRSIERVRVGSVLEERQNLREYLPTGELARLIQRRSGSPDLVRWLKYDSIGRLVLNVEPNTSTGFSPDPNSDPSTIHAWRYAYNDAGDLVGTSDARGCGINYFYDTAGRMTAEDYSPCEAGQLAYSAPDFVARTGIETLYHYDVADSSTGSIVDAGGTAFTFDANLLWGRLVSVSDRGSRGVTRYDALGRTTGGALQIAKPGAASASLATRYAPRWYVFQATFDAADRLVESSTGATLPELLDAANKSVVTRQYSARGVATSVGSSYGTLLAHAEFDADGRMLAATLGDAAPTERAYAYDELRRIQSVQTYRAGPGLWSTPTYPVSTTGENTQQLSLEDYEFEYDAVSNITKITDYRLPSEWSGSAKPVTRTFEYDDSYRLTRTLYEYSGGSDSWTSPFAAENSGSVEGPKPSPHVSFDQRVNEQHYEYDHLGNLTKTTDDASGFYDRSLGTQTHGTAASGPHQLQAASNRTLAPSSTRKGDLDTKYDAAGNLTDLVVRRDGPCLPTGASCWQRFRYHWDELGQIDLAQRWDLAGAERTSNDGLNEPLPSRNADVELRYTYDSGGGRVLKTAVDPLGNQSHTVYISSSYELRRTVFTDGDYSLTPTTATVYVAGGGVRGRVVYSEEDLPTLTSGQRHLFLELSDYLGSNSFIIDHETGELVEYATYQSYGATDSNYRPERWGQFREEYKFSGKEEDVEVGLAYFGARYLVIGLNRWASPDAVTIHSLRGDANPYAYVAGRPTVAVDPDGNFAFLAVLAVAIIVSAAVNVGTQANEVGWSNINWGGVGVAALAGGAGAAVGGPVGAWAGGALAGGLLGMGASAAVASGVGATTGAMVGSAAGSMTSYAVGTGSNNALASMGARGFSHQSFSWGTMGRAGAIGAVTGAASYGTGAMLASSKLGQAATGGLTRALGQSWGKGVAAGLYGAAGGVTAAGTATAMSGGRFDASTALMAAGAAGVSAGVSIGVMTTRATDPTGGKLSPKGQYIPRDEKGNVVPLRQQTLKNSTQVPLPDPNAEGRPHTTLGGRVGRDGVTYRQSATFEGSWPKANGQDVPWGRVDWHDHSRPKWHSSPHLHPLYYNGPNGWQRDPRSVPFNPVIDEGVR